MGVKVGDKEAGYMGAGASPRLHAIALLSLTQQLIEEHQVDNPGAAALQEHADS